MSWGYGTDNGPKTWVNNFPIAAGHRQSPIDIVHTSAKYDEKLKSNALSIDYTEENDMVMDNTGFSVKANIKEASVIAGGPLGDKYRLEQFHLHWGSCDKQGSEHTIDGKMYPAELHLVHWNQDKYKSFAEAADKPDGLAVFGIFLQIGSEHKPLKAFTDCLERVKFRSKQDKVKGTFNPACLLPDNTSDYWTYPGSLTTPPLYESVTWIVFKQVIQVSESQLTAFRSLCCNDCEDDHIVDNYRPPLTLGGRTLLASFK